jgi:S-DNA-T family DNA segregation ATPase FtsK/SpoIIIE
MDFQRIKTDLLALVLLAVALFLGLSLVSYDPADAPSQTVFPGHAETANLCGPVGAIVAHHFRTTFGIGAFFILLSIVTTDIRLFSCREISDRIFRLTGMILSLVAFCISLHVLQPEVVNAPLVGNGGYLGAWGGILLEQHVSTAGTLILISCMFLAGLILSGDSVVLWYALLTVTAPLRMFQRIAFGPRISSAESEEEDSDWDEEPSDEEDWDEDLSGENPEPNDESEYEEDDAEEELETEGEPEPPVRRKPIKVNPPVMSKKTSREHIMERLDACSRVTADGNFDLPDLELLKASEEIPYERLAKNAQKAAVTLENTFKEFGYNVRVAEIDTGPVVTQFELELEAGLRLSKISALADDLAIALRVPAVRVVAPIPGKNTVGVEVPNEKQVIVRMKELIESCPEDIEKSRLPIFLGKDVSGHPLTIDLTKMPHLLIAGRTGTGKSVCLNTLILSLLMTRSPDDVKMLLIDPKMVELSPFKRIPHLMHPVITDMNKAEAVLAWAVEKMEERYDLLSRCGVRHLDGFNKLGKEAVLNRLEIDPEDPEQMLEAESIPEKMPYIVIVADEMADMIMTSGKDVEGHIIRLAQKSRAVGIHLVLATQKPTVDVITGLIKSNLPARISFQVASRTDSRVVLDEMGADRLLGNGDMLYLAPGTSNLTRAQGTYIDDEETQAIIDFFSDHEPQYSTELAQLSTSGTGSKSDSEAMKNRDELYEDAIENVIREGRGSVSLLQRMMGIGYGRAARLIDYMAEDGIVGEYNGSQAREVLYTPEQWESMQQEEELEEAAV